MSKRQTAGIISTYTSDTMGVASALFELGGMTVMHDASGCNSTYNTHDEPRWYDWDSMVYISALTEADALMGNDEKLIGDIVSAAGELSPAFIAVAGTPIPMMTGMDIPAAAELIEERTGIPSFGFNTNGMNSYIAGASAAFAALAERLVKPRRGGAHKDGISVNILGLTPLDFSVNGAPESIIRRLGENGIEVASAWAMGSSLNEIEYASEADASLVVSYSGYAAARVLKRRFGIPVVVGVPIGDFCGDIVSAIKRAAEAGEDANPLIYDKMDERTVLIGESVYQRSLAAAIYKRTGKLPRVLCPLETDAALLNIGDAIAPDEDDILPLLKGADTVMADPLYKPIVKNARFIPIGHEAFSGRIARCAIPELISGFDKFYEKEVISL